MNAADAIWLVPFGVLGALILVGALYVYAMDWWCDELARINRARMDRVEELLGKERHTADDLFEMQATLDDIDRTHDRIREIRKSLGRAA